jgi:glycosyltransferase involved in cell wall biosynthesis
MEKQKQAVTVIIPNYNHARFLPERLDSVLSQTYQNLQVILMDDCSTDDSRRILDRYAQQDTRIQLVYNEQNSGSTFKQWNKGISLASGEYVWIAESDDVAELTFVERLVDCLVDHPDAGLAYCQSRRIDEEGRRAGIAFVSEDGLGTQDFYLPGDILAKNYMPITTIIPNASAALMRRSVLAQVGPAPENMRLAGDWVFWIRYMLRTNVCYVAETLNFFRTHSQSVRTKMLEDGLIEYATVLAYIKKVVAPKEDVYNKSLDMLIERWFHVFIYSSLTLRGHRAFMREMQVVEPAFQILFTRRVFARLFRDRLSGLKMLVGDKLLGRQSLGIATNAPTLGRRH